MKRKMKWMGSIIGFVVLLGCLSGMTDVLRDKTNAELIYPFWEEEPDTVDVILVGSSKMYRSIYPLELWHEYGITSWNLGSSEQPVAASYYLAKEAVRRQHPKIVVMETRMSFVDNKYYSYARVHQVSDNMPFSKNKIQMICDLIPRKDWLEFYFPISIYHDRWSSLGKTDFEKIHSSSKGAGYSVGTAPNPSLAVIDESQKREVPNVSKEYIRKMNELCDANGAQLVLMAVPSLEEETGGNVQEVVNGVSDLAQELGVPYINMLYHMQEIGLDYRTDYADIHHLNIHGAKKASAYLGKYITEHYAIQNRRQDEDIRAAWDDEYEVYLTEQEKLESQMNET